MIVYCCSCSKWYDDEFRSSVCPHSTFSANDGQNNFKHYHESWLSNNKPDSGEAVKYYYEFLEKNKIAG